MGPECRKWSLTSLDNLSEQTCTPCKGWGAFRKRGCTCDSSDRDERCEKCTCTECSGKGTVEPCIDVATHQPCPDCNSDGARKIGDAFCATTTRARSASSPSSSTTP